MKNIFLNIFYKHPNSVCMTYFQHFKFSLYLSFYFAKKSIQSFIHAVFPNTYITSSSNVQKELCIVFKDVGCK